MGTDNAAGVEDIVGTVIPPVGTAAPYTAVPDTTNTGRRGRLRGSRVKVKGGAIVVRPPRKAKVSHGWFLQIGLASETEDSTRWGEIKPLTAKSVKTAVREAKEAMAALLAEANGVSYACRIFEVKYQNLSVKLVPQKPKIVM